MMRVPASVISEQYPELRLNRAASWAVHDGLDIPVSGQMRRGVHLRCGSAHLTQNWAGQRTMRWTGVDDNRALIDLAKSRPFDSANNISAFFANGGEASAVNAPLRGDYVYRCEPIHRTSIASSSIQHIALEWGLRGDCEDARAVASEICRIGRPGAVVVLLHYSVLEIDDWSLNDDLRPKLLHLRRSLRRPTRGFGLFNLRQASGSMPMNANARFSLAEVMRHIEESPECIRLRALRGWPATGYLFNHLRKRWGRHTNKRDVRRRVAVWVGSVPTRSAEHFLDQPVLGGA